jgi:hypothetical protein
LFVIKLVLLFLKNLFGFLKLIAESSVAAAVSSVLHLEHPVGRVAAVVAESIHTDEPAVGAE